MTFRIEKFSATPTATVKNAVELQIMINVNWIVDD